MKNGEIIQKFCKLAQEAKEIHRLMQKTPLFPSTSEEIERYSGIREKENLQILKSAKKYNEETNKFARQKYYDKMQKLLLEGKFQSDFKNINFGEKIYEIQSRIKEFEKEVNDFLSLLKSDSSQLKEKGFFVLPFRNRKIRIRSFEKLTKICEGYLYALLYFGIYPRQGRPLKYGYTEFVNLCKIKLLAHWYRENVRRIKKEIRKLLKKSGYSWNKIGIKKKRSIARGVKKNLDIKYSTKFIMRAMEGVPIKAENTIKRVPPLSDQAIRYFIIQEVPIMKKSQRSWSPTKISDTVERLRSIFHSKNLPQGWELVFY